MIAGRKIKVAIADDHSVVREGLRALFRTAPDIILVGEARDGEEAITMVQQRKPDVIILDISMPHCNGIEATKRLKDLAVKSKILILSMYDDEDHVYQMIQAGADGYILKNANREELFEAIRAVTKGRNYFGPLISALLVDEFVRRFRGPRETSKTNGPVLTKRETEVLRYVTKGMTSREIAKELFLSVRTVNSHRNNLMQKLKIHDTAGLVRYAMANGLLEIS